jgi:hypothetical protein
MRIAKATGSSSGTFTSQPDAIFLDACAIMWIVHCPSKGVFKDYMDGFVNYVLSKLTIASNVFVIFDRYKEKSIKGNIRVSRASGLHQSKKHVIALTTLLLFRDVVRNVTHKEQLTEMITEELLDRKQGLISPNNLAVTGKADFAVEIRQRERVERPDVRFDHEEADVIISHQVVQFASKPKMSLKVISDDTDIFVLLTHKILSEVSAFCISCHGANFS